LTLVVLWQGYYQWICRIGGVTHHGLDFTVRQRMRGELDVAGQPIGFRSCQPHYHMQVPFMPAWICVRTNRCTHRVN